MRLREIGALFFHFAVFDLGAQFLQGIDVKIDGARADADRRRLSGTMMSSSVRPSRAPIIRMGMRLEPRIALRNVGGFQFGGGDLEGVIFFIPIDFRADFAA